VLDVALKIPLTALSLGGRRQGHYPAHPGAQAFGDALDGTTLAGSITPFEDDNNLEILVLNPFLQFDQFDLQSAKFL